MFSADDALRVISARGATGKLGIVAENGDEAVIWFDLGMIVSAEFGDDLDAEPARVVDAVGSWILGTFDFSAGDPPAADAAPQPAEMLLSWTDEDALSLIAAETKIEMAQALANAPAIIDVVTWQVLASIVPGMTVNDLATALHAPVVEVIAVIQDLVHRGLVDAEVAALPDTPAAEPDEVVVPVVVDDAPTGFEGEDLTGELDGALLAFDADLLQDEPPATPGASASLADRHGLLDIGIDAPAPAETGNDSTSVPAEPVVPQPAARPALFLDPSAAPDPAPASPELADAQPAETFSPAADTSLSEAADTDADNADWLLADDGPDSADGPDTADGDHTSSLVTDGAHRGVPSSDDEPLPEATTSPDPSKDNRSVLLRFLGSVDS